MNDPKSIDSAGLGSQASKPGPSGMVSLSSEAGALPSRSELISKDTKIQLSLGPRFTAALPDYHSIATPSDAKEYWQAVQQFFIEQQYHEIIFAQLREVVDNIKERHERPLAHRAVAWVTTDGIVCIGAERPHPNPPQWNHAEIAASTVALCSGQLDSVVAVLVWDECAQRRDLISEVGYGVLRSHLAGHIGDALIFGVNTHSSSMVQGTFAAVRPQLGWSDIQTSPLKQIVPTFRPILWELPRPFDHEYPQEDLLGIIRERLLEPMMLNSTCDGSNRPARKAHAAAAVSGKHVIVAPNARDPMWPGQVRCAEKNLVSLVESIAASSGMSSLRNWETTLVYSSHYISNGTNGVPKGENVLPASCPPCLGDLSEHVNPGFGDMNLINLSPTSRESRMLSIYGLQEYAKRDRDSLPELGESQS